jgi:hypothetical protein
MDVQPDVKSLYERVERLEKQNRWMKRMGVVAILPAVALLISGQAKVDTKKTVEATEFVLKDTNGGVRAKLGMGAVLLMKNGPGLVLYDEHGQERASVGTSDEETRIDVSSGGTLTSSTFSSMWAGMPGKTGSGVGSTGPSGVVRMNLDGGVAGGPQIGLQDKEGYEINIGKTDLVFTKSGKKQQTSAASVVMFDKDKKVLWSAP